MVRVTRPGGRVLVIAYGDPSGFEALHFLVSAVQAVVPEFEGPSEDEPLLEFQVADPEVLRHRFNEAGLTEVVVDTATEERLELTSGRQLWDWCLGSNPVPGMVVSGLDDDQRAEVIRVLDGMVRERATSEGTAILTAPLNIGVGTK